LLIASVSNQFSRTIQSNPETLNTSKDTIKTDKSGKKNQGKIDKLTNPSPKKNRTIGNPELIWVTAQFLIIIGIAYASIYSTFDTVVRDRKFVSYYGAEREWTKLFKTVESLKEYDVFVNFEYNKALANAGKLAENVLNYPQLAGSQGLFLDGSVSSDVPFICSDQYYDLGFINESTHWTFEAQTIFPNSPRLMKRLVQLHLVKGQYKIAEKFLNRLSKNMLYQDWVDEHRKFLQDTNLITKDPDFAWKRKCQPLGNFTAGNYKEKLYKLMESNPQNKMAWEYLVCSYVLDSDLGTFERLVRENKDLKYNPLPKSWDEAMMLFFYVKQVAPGSEDVKFTLETQKKFMSFLKAMQPFGNDWQSLRQSLRNEFGTTYWYYAKCLSPKVTKVQIKQQK
jgi:hypothetical protein